MKKHMNIFQIKEHDKTSEKYINEREIGDLHERLKK